MLQLYKYFAPDTIKRLYCDGLDKCFVFPDSVKLAQDYQHLLARANYRYLGEKTYPTVTECLADKRLKNYDIVLHYAVHDFKKYCLSDKGNNPTLEAILDFDTDVHLRVIEEALSEIAIIGDCIVNSQ